MAVKSQYAQNAAQPTAMTSSTARIHIHPGNPASRRLGQLLGFGSVIAGRLIDGGQVRWWAFVVALIGGIGLVPT
jgi:hypothetical protein